jgi:DNA repair exonuclease SbcCD ATPase subunit
MLHQLGPEVETLAESTHFLESPMILGVGAVLIAFAKLRESIAETDKKLDEMAESAAKPVGDMMEQIATAAEHATSAYEKFAEAAKKIEDGGAVIEKQLRARLDLYNEEIELIEKLSKAQGNPDEGQFDRAKKVNEINQTQSALTQAEREKAGLSIDGLIQEKEAAEARAGNKKSSQSALEDRTKEAQKALDEATQKWENILNISHAIENGSYPQMVDALARGAATGALFADPGKAREEMETARQARDNAKLAETTNKETGEKAKSSAEALGRQIDERTQREAELTKQIEGYKEALEKARKSLELFDKYPFEDCLARVEAVRAGDKLPPRIFA